MRRSLLQLWFLTLLSYCSGAAAASPPHIQRRSPEQDLSLPLKTLYASSSALNARSSNAPPNPDPNPNPWTDCFELSFELPADPHGTILPAAFHPGAIPEEVDIYKLPLAFTHGTCFVKIGLDPGALEELSSWDEIRTTFRALVLRARTHRQLKAVASVGQRSLIHLSLVISLSGDVHSDEVVD